MAPRASMATRKAGCVYIAEDGVMRTECGEGKGRRYESVRVRKEVRCIDEV